MDPVTLFNKEKKRNIDRMHRDAAMLKTTSAWIVKSGMHKYSYNFSWLGRPIIQYPQDMVAMQEIIWRVKPDLIIETGIAHGGSLVFYASLLELIGGSARIVGVDIEIRPHNMAAIKKHPMYKRITLIEGSSIEKSVIDKVRRIARRRKRVLVVLDSNHSHQHVLKELELYSPLVTKGSYLVVFDTVVEDLPPDFVTNRPWGKGDNPKTAVWEFLKRNDRFVIDKSIQDKLLITVAPDGYLLCVKDR